MGSIPAHPPFYNRFPRNCLQRSANGLLHNGGQLLDEVAIAHVVAAGNGL
jgi:hypothetical protein